MEIASRDPATAQQIKSMLEGRPWVEVAQFASYHCQIKALGLAPWQPPPCHDDGPESAALLEEMLEAGISQFEPDPAGALRKAKSGAMSISPLKRRKVPSPRKAGKQRSVSAQGPAARRAARLPPAQASR